MPAKNFGFGLVLCGWHPHPGGWYSDDNGQWVSCLECRRLGAMEVLASGHVNEYPSPDVVKEDD
jgi:hypothetical protein